MSETVDQTQIQNNWDLLMKRYGKYFVKFVHLNSCMLYLLFNCFLVKKAGTTITEDIWAPYINDFTFSQNLRTSEASLIEINRGLYLEHNDRNVLKTSMLVKKRSILINLIRTQ